MKKNIVVLSDWNKNQLPLHDDKVNVKMKKAHVASTPAGVVALKAWALASSMIFFTLTLISSLIPRILNNLPMSVYIPSLLNH